MLGAVGLDRHHGVLDLAEGGQNRLLVLGEELLGAGDLDLHPPFVLPGLEEGAEEVETEGQKAGIEPVGDTGPEIGAQGEGRETRRFGDPDARGLGGQQLLGLANVRTAFDQLRRQTGRDLGRKDLIIDGKPAGDRHRRLAQEQTDGVLGLRPQPLEGLDADLGAGELDARLVNVHLRHHARVEADLDDVQRTLADFDGALRDVEPFVDAPELEVGAGDVRHKGDGDHTVGFLGGEQVAQGGLVGPPHPAPQIHDVGNVRKCHRGGRVVSLGRVREGGVRTVDDARVEIGADDTESGPCLLDAGQRNLQIEIAVEGGADEVVEGRVAEDLPPWEIGDRAARWGVAVVGRVLRGLRAHVVGTEGAPGQQCRDKEYSGELTHQLGFRFQRLSSKPNETTM